MALSARRGGYRAGASARRPPLWHRVDGVLWGVPLGLSLLAGLLIASTQRQASDAVWWQHWVTAAVGFALALALARLPVERITRLRWPIYGLTVLSLIAVRLIGTSALGAQSWIAIGGFYVQPSEFAKLAAILLLAEVLAQLSFFSPNAKVCIYSMCVRGRHRHCSLPSSTTYPLSRLHRTFRK